MPTGGANKSQLVGQRFGRLVVRSYKETRNAKQYWTCLCDCGSERIVSSSMLNSGNTKSCGCVRNEKTIKRNMTHGLSGHKYYGVWKDMISRCYNPNSGEFHNYGGRGIMVCDEWRTAAAFLAWCDSQTIPDGYSLDRFPDLNGNYKPDNCRFASDAQQTRNTRSNIWVEINGERLVLTDAVAKYGNVSYTQAKDRIRDFGWSPADAILIPAYGGKP